MIALAYLAAVAASLVVLAVALRPRRAPAPTRTPPVMPAVSAADLTPAEVRVILAAAAHLAARLDTAA